MSTLTSKIRHDETEECDDSNNDYSHDHEWQMPTMIISMMIMMTQKLNTTKNNIAMWLL